MKGDTMELRNIITFLKVAEIGSFTKAAEILGYVQSTVTVQIKQLENGLGVSLFDRIGKKVSLTPMGEEFFIYANQIVQISEKSKLIGKKPIECKGQLRIGILESLFAWVLTDLLPKYHENFPYISIITKTAPGNDLFQMLMNNQLDIIFLLDKKISANNCICAFSDSVDIVFVTHPKNPLASKTSISLEEVLKQQIIHTERNGIYRQSLEDLAAKKNLAISPFWEIDNTGTIVKLLKNGLGVSFLPEYTVKDSISQGELILLDVIDCSTQFWSQIFYHKNKWLTPQMKGFIDVIRESYSLND